MNASLPTYVLINPASRSGYGLKLWNTLLPKFRKAGVTCKVLLSSGKTGIRELAERITTSDTEINLIILGGDGTLNDAVNGIRDFSRVNLGYIPVGSANDFGKAVGITSPEAAVDAMLSDTAAVCRDLGIITYYIEGSDMPQTRYFNISAGIGFDADCCWLSDHTRFKKILNHLHLGSLIYLVSAVRLIMANRCLNHTITIGDEAPKVYPRSLFTVCMNTCYEGGGFQFCPDADPTDGRLELCNASGIGRIDFFLLFPKAYSGGHVGQRGISSAAGTQFEIISEGLQHFHADGEVIDEKISRMEVTLLPAHVRWLL